MSLLRTELAWLAISRAISDASSFSSTKSRSAGGGGENLEIAPLPFSDMERITIFPKARIWSWLRWIVRGPRHQEGKGSLTSPPVSLICGDGAL